jgi:hypothetical protein
MSLDVSNIEMLWDDIDSAHYCVAGLCGRKRPQPPVYAGPSTIMFIADKTLYVIKRYTFKTLYVRRIQRFL